MDNTIWIEHLVAWKKFLSERINATDDVGEIIKYERQIKTIERVRCGAVLNPYLLSEFIASSNDYDDEECCDEYYFELNESQKIAVNSVLNAGVLSLIQGPPGTGKTQVIAEICLQLYKRNPGIRILVCSETHVAVNNLLLRLSDYNNDMRLVRIRDKENDDTIDEFLPENIIDSYLKWASDDFIYNDMYGIIEEELKEYSDDNPRKKNQIEKSLALSANIVGMTCNRSAAYDFRDMTEMFDVVIIDEVCKATLPEILSPMTISERAILIGDPKQLPPVFCSEDQEIINSIENCNLNKFMYIDRLFENNKNVCVLDTQYRMSNQIGNMISELFYDGIIKNGRDEDVEDGLNWITYNPSKQWPIQESKTTKKPQIFNDDECMIVNDIVEKIIEEDQDDISIAVIAPYRAQVDSLRKKCIRSDSIKIDTVDGFQGKESDVVIFSVTRTKGSYRFLADDRRLNVALSRARNKIYIVGVKEYAEKEPLLEKIMNKCKLEECDLQ